jgi:hypothetical protein
MIHGRVSCEVDTIVAPCVDSAILVRYRLWLSGDLLLGKVSRDRD